MTTFTARNGAQLSSQIDRYEAANPEGLKFNFGRATDGTWYVHGEFGGMLRDRLSFAEMIAEMNERVADHAKYA